MQATTRWDPNYDFSHNLISATCNVININWKTNKKPELEAYIFILKSDCLAKPRCPHVGMSTQLSPVGSRGRRVAPVNICGETLLRSSSCAAAIVVRDQLVTDSHCVFSHGAAARSQTSEVAMHTTELID